MRTAKSEDLIPVNIKLNDYLNRSINAFSEICNIPVTFLIIHIGLSRNIMQVKEYVIFSTYTVTPAVHADKGLQKPEIFQQK